MVSEDRYPVERARAYAELGAALRRDGRPIEAREPLRLAVDLAHRYGDSALKERALGELRATGARPRRPLIAGAGALTRSERRIAELAAAGRLNREIASELFLTIGTVEFHLRNAYRKLGIASRKALGAALGAHPDVVRARFNVRLLPAHCLAGGSTPRWRLGGDASTTTSTKLGRSARTAGLKDERATLRTSLPRPG